MARTPSARTSLCHLPRGTRWLLCVPHTQTVRSFSLVNESDPSGASVGRAYVFVSHNGRLYVTTRFACGVMFSTDDGYLAEADRQTAAVCEWGDRQGGEGKG